MAVHCVDNILRADIARLPSSKHGGCKLARECASALVESAIAQGSSDNVTAMVAL
ncbi:hypothetical protein T492DRAFT_973828 [Pavlovales sp. CCMP2436]|nr:hypothetical protein T492DRAFT_973828 [Pavlovales sp. CCMP2436]